MARQGKIARLPHHLRQEVNSRILNGETATGILAWLNLEPEAIKVWESIFEGAPANPQNLSEWRLGGYKDWLRDRKKIEDLKTLASFSSELAKAGGRISDGAAAIAGGKILEALESAVALKTDEEEDAGLDLGSLVQSIAKLRAGDIANDRLELNRKQHALKRDEVKLSREKFEKQTVEQFLKFARTPEAQAILENGKPKGIQVAELRKLMFGDRKAKS